MEVVPVMVAYHTNAWIRVGIESYLQQFPGERLLVINNSPPRDAPDWQPSCDEERYWLGAHPQVILVENPSSAFAARSHGAGVDQALAWCRAQGARVMIHLEPDCLITGTRWRDNLLAALDQGAWMAGGFRQKHGPIHPTPSAWQVAHVPASFQAWQRRVPDEAHPRFRELVDLVLLQAIFDPHLWPYWKESWDTGEKAWFDAAVQDRTALVDIPGFHHYWLGSSARRLPEAALTAMFPETRPFFSLARARFRPRAVEDCTFRRDVLRNASEETAHCRCLEEAAGLKQAAVYRVRRDACQACCAAFPPTPNAPNPVIASLLYGLAVQMREQAAAGDSADLATELQARTKRFLDVTSA